MVCFRGVVRGVVGVWLWYSVFRCNQGWLEKKDYDDCLMWVLGACLMDVVRVYLRRG